MWQYRKTIGLCNFKQLLSSMGRRNWNLNAFAQISILPKTYQAGQANISFIGPGRPVIIVVDITLKNVLSIANEYPNRRKPRHFPCLLPSEEGSRRGLFLYGGLLVCTMCMFTQTQHLPIVCLVNALSYHFWEAWQSYPDATLRDDPIHQWGLGLALCYYYNKGI